MDKTKKLVLIVSIASSFIAFLDGSIVNVALPAMSEELGGGLTMQQWVNNAYLITLGALILAAGSFSDLFGRRRMLRYGLYGFLITSLLCAVAPTAEFLIVARALQGVAGALITPSSLALIMSHFSGNEKPKAVGIWTAWTGMAYIFGPLLGGVFVDIASWRLIFGINIIPIVITIIMLLKLPGVPHEKRTDRVDWKGIWLAMIGLTGVVFALIEQGVYGWTHWVIITSLSVGVGAFAWLMIHEKRAKSPLVPLDLFKERNFTFGNIATWFIYAALPLQGFLLVIFLQQVAHYSALVAGIAFLPVTLVMFVLSSRFGALAGIYGPRWFMGLGPMVSAIGVLLITLRTDISADYWMQLFPGILIFGLGLSITVAPLTATVLGAVAENKSGIASAVNNTVARIAGLVAIAAIGIVTGETITLEGFHNAMIVCAVLLVVGGAISIFGISNDTLKKASKTLQSK